MDREKAIKWVDDRMCWGRGTFTENHPPNIDECWEAGVMAIKALKTLSAERTGEWAVAYLDHESIGDRPKTLHCSECNWITSFPSAYCPNCGAKMGGDE